RLGRRNRLDVGDRGLAGAAETVDLTDPLVGVAARAGGGLEVAVALGDRGVLPPAEAHALLEEPHDGGHLLWGHLVRLGVPDEADTDPERVAGLAVTAAAGVVGHPVDGRALVDAARREHEEGVGDAGAEPLL